MVGKFGSNHAIISQNLRVMYIQPSRETKLLAKIEREREKKRKEKKKDYLYCNTGPKKWKRKHNGNFSANN